MRAANRIEIPLLHVSDVLHHPLDAHNANSTLRLELVAIDAAQFHVVSV